MSLKDSTDDFCPMSRLLGQFEGWRMAQMAEARLRRILMAGMTPGTIEFDSAMGQVRIAVEAARRANHDAIRQVKLIRRFRFVR